MKKNEKNDKIEKKESTATRRHLIMLAVNTVVMFVLFALCSQRFPLTTYIVYTVVSAAFAFTYVIYNRAFTRKNLKPENLPDTMDPAQKSEYIADGARRLEKSKWMPTFIVPIIVIYAYELISIYVLDFLS